MVFNFIVDVQKITIILDEITNTKLLVMQFAKFGVN